MAIHFTIEAAGGRHVFVLTSTDQTVMDLFGHGPLFNAVGQSWVEAQEFARAELLAGARALMADVRAQWDLLPYRYATEVRMMGREDLKSSGSGGVHGFRLDGRIHAIYGGPGRCYLQEWAYGPDGRGVVVATRDVRREKRIETDDWGLIKISRRKIDVRLPQSLEGLIAFLEGCADETVRGRTSEGGASVMELVRRAGEGDESAEEEALFERGDAARAELLKKAADPKARKHHGTIAWLLLTVLPSAESRAAVEAMIEREPDEERRRELLVLLASALARQPFRG